MGQYFDKLVQINESLTNELKGFGIVLEETIDTIEISTDSLTDEQKKQILSDNGVDKNVVNGMSSGTELDSALQATLNNNELKKESQDDGEFIIRIDDNDLELHGYVEVIGQVDGELKLTDEEGGAAVFASEEAALDEKNRICDVFHYDPQTITIKPKELNDSSSEDENWVSIDSMTPSATTMNPIPSI